MTTSEIVQALRCTSTPGGPTGDCTKCQYWKKEQLNGRLKEKLGTDTWTSCDVDKVGLDAADLIECLTAEVADLRKELEWKDMVIALAQRKQAEAEAERDALLALMKAHRACYACKRADCCNGSNADVVDCMLCTEVACPCVGCRDSSRWEWRGLPKSPEEGDT